MPRDPRPYITIHDAMPNHPKIEALSDGAFRLLVSTWCWCNQLRTDGRVPAASWKKRGTARTRAELITAGLAVETGDGVEMHDYLQHQRSADEIDELSEKRRAAGSKGGKARASGLASAKANASDIAKQTPKQTGSKAVAEQKKQPNSTTSNGSPTVPAGAIPRVVRLYVEACRDAGIAAPEESQAKVERAARSLLSQGYPQTDVEDAARNAAVGGWTDLATQLQRDAARASPAVNGHNGRPSATERAVRDALAVAHDLEQLDQLDQPERRALP